MSQALKWKKKGSFLFYINSGNPEATLILTPDQTRLYYTVVAQLVVMAIFS